MSVYPNPVLFLGVGKAIGCHLGPQIVEDGGVLSLGADDPGSDLDFGLEGVHCPGSDMGKLFPFRFCVEPCGLHDVGRVLVCSYAPIFADQR